MNVRTMKSGAAWQKGADLWILPPLRSAEITKRLDWPLNLQISKALHREAPRLHPSLEKSAAELGIESRSGSKAPLLIASHGMLPNQWTAVLHQEAADWIHAGLEVWRSLKVPVVRFFLPATLSPDEFAASCPKWADVEAVEIVLPGEV